MKKNEAPIAILDKIINSRFSPPIISDWWRAAKVKMKVKNVNFFSSIHKHVKKGDTIFILGNGPSLKEQLENSWSIMASSPCICVNSFVDTDWYTKIKPCVFVLMDPVWFLSDRSKIADPMRNKVETVFQNLFDKTEWNMDLIVPSYNTNCEHLKQLEKNPFINILYVNVLNCSSYSNKKSMFELFNKNMLAAPALNVLNTATYLAIFWKYEKIILIGADSSWLEELSVDQKTNVVYTEQKYFFGTLKRFCNIDSEYATPAKLHETLFYIRGAFEAYWLLREYADFNSVSVFNASKKSWIDAFERKSLEELC